MRHPLSIAVVALAGVLLASCGNQEPADLGSAVSTPGAPTTQPSSTSELTATYVADYSCDSVYSDAPNELPALTLPCMDGTGLVDMNLMKGPLALTIWASWCVPCKKELPAFTAVNSKLEAAGYPARILGLNWIDDPNSAVQAAQEWGLNFPSVHDADALMRAPLGINAQPATLFIDARGTIVHIERAPIDDEQDLVNKIKEYLGVEVPT